MPETSVVPPIVNRATKFVLRSPLHGMVSKTVVMIPIQLADRPCETVDRI